MPDTIKFLEENNWKNVSKKCRELNIWARNEVNKLLKIEPISDNKFLGQMSSIPIISKDVLQDQIEFYLKYKIQIPFFKWHDKEFFRISIQAYNTKEDILKLLEALDDKYNS
jgi:isopenicillin-N epimerase